jgi:hypothetical protein
MSSSVHPYDVGSCFAAPDVAGVLCPSKCDLPSLPQQNRFAIHGDGPPRKDRSGIESDGGSHHSYQRQFAVAKQDDIRLSPGAGPLANRVQSSSIGSSVQYAGSVSTSGR